MSYDVALHDPITDRVLDAGERFTDGGTYAIGGTDFCELNITYNYVRVFGSLVRDLHGKAAGSTLPVLEAFCREHATAPTSDDYWEATPGNAAAAIRRLVSFAHRHPNGIWRVS